MTSRSSIRGRARVVIAGGGVAALEAALALQALAHDAVDVTLVAPEPHLTFRPAAALEAFGEPAAPRYDLRTIASDIGARFCAARVEAVASQARTVRLSSGTRLDYDALVLATGARASASIPGALTFRDHRDVPHLHAILAELESDALNRLAFAVPAGASWALPLYELALLSAARAERAGAGTEIILVTPERRPLEIFGADASDAVDDELAGRNVRFAGAAGAMSWRDGALAVRGDAPIRADRVVTIPQLRVQRMTGTPARWWGFVPTDSFGRIEGMSDVYAAGDVTTYPVKQGGLATQQADRIAHAIAASLGMPVKGLRATHVLRARLIGGPRPLLLRTELDWHGRPVGGTVEFEGREGATAFGGRAGHRSGMKSEAYFGTAGEKVFGRYLTPYLEGLERGTPAAA